MSALALRVGNEEYPLRRGRVLVIGSHRDADVVLKGNRENRVSRFHCAIVFRKPDDNGNDTDNTKCFVRDLGSRHGTFLNGERITRAYIKSGGRIGIGGFTIEVFGRNDNPVKNADSESVFMIVKEQEHSGDEQGDDEFVTYGGGKFGEYIQGGIKGVFDSLQTDLQDTTTWPDSANQPGGDANKQLHDGGQDSKQNERIDSSMRDLIDKSGAHSISMIKSELKSFNERANNFVEVKTWGNPITQSPLKQAEVKKLVAGGGIVEVARDLSSVILPIVSKDEQHGFLRVELNKANFEHQSDFQNVLSEIDHCRESAASILLLMFQALIDIKGTPKQWKWDCEHGIVVSTLGVNAALDTVLRFAKTEASILLTGPTGSGKTILAKVAHDVSKRSGKFVQLNCAAISETLAESELFGHEKGAFTGADKAKKGVIETADKGTLFLDEIGELSLSIQAKLLKAIDEGEILPVGGTEAKSINVRLVCATNRDIPKMISAGTFREDLFHRISDINVELPSLDKNRMQLTLLVFYFIDQLDSNIYTMNNLHRDALELMIDYNWPGNIRRLEKFIKVLATRVGKGVSAGKEVVSEQIAAAIKHVGHRPHLAHESNVAGNQTSSQLADVDLFKLGLEAAVKKYEKECLELAINQSGGDRKEACQKLKLYKVDPETKKITKEPNTSLLGQMLRAHGIRDRAERQGQIRENPEN